MINTATLMSAAKLAQGIPSDYRLSKVLGVTENTLYNYRHGRTPDDERALKLAQMARLHPGFVLVSMAAERAKDEPTRAVLIAAAHTLAKAFPGQTVDILSALSSGKTTMDKGTPADSLKTPEYTSWQV